MESDSYWWLRAGAGAGVRLKRSRGRRKSRSYSRSRSQSRSRNKNSSSDRFRRSSTSCSQTGSIFFTTVFQGANLLPQPRWLWTYLLFKTDGCRVLKNWHMLACCYIFNWVTFYKVFCFDNIALDLLLRIGFFSFFFFSFWSFYWVLST